MLKQRIVLLRKIFFSHIYYGANITKNGSFLRKNEKILKAGECFFPASNSLKGVQRSKVICIS